MQDEEHKRSSQRKACGSYRERKCQLHEHCPVSVFLRKHIESMSQRFRFKLRRFMIEILGTSTEPSLCHAQMLLRRSERCCFHPHERYGSDDEGCCSGDAFRKERPEQEYVRKAGQAFRSSDTGCKDAERHERHSHKQHFRLMLQALLACLLLLERKPAEPCCRLIKRASATSFSVIFRALFHALHLPVRPFLP